jgi:hypothetical protein
VTAHTIIAGELHVDLVTGCERARIDGELVVKVLHLETKVTTNHLFVGVLHLLEHFSLNWAVNINILFGQHFSGVTLVEKCGQNVSDSTLETLDLGAQADNRLSKVVGKYNGEGEGSLGPGDILCVKINEGKFDFKKLIFFPFLLEESALVLDVALPGNTVVEASQIESD